ncbi:MAG: hypothetical protein ACFE9D_08440 [Promethearchaeota archaeon]
MPQGAALLEFDQKMGPIFKVAIPNTLEVTQDETIVLFTTRTKMDEGFTSLKVKDRNWVTYLNPPYLYCILLTPAEHQNDFEIPMTEVLNNFQPNNRVSTEVLNELYDDIVSRIGDGLRRRLSEQLIVQKLLAFIRESQEALRPSWSIKTGYHYPRAESITGESPEDTNALLGVMMTAGLLYGRICGNIAICPQCSNPKIGLHASCPKCGLPTLEAGIAIEHFTCEYTAFIEKFSTSQGLVCPQCHALLSTGTYRSLGRVYHCVTCKSYPPSVEPMFGCLTCQFTFTANEAKYLPVYCFTIAEETE